jgi:hypothetical protein
MDGRGRFSDTRAASTQESTSHVEVFQVVVGRGRGRLQTARGLTPLVGREDEMWLLLSR